MLRLLQELLKHYAVILTALETRASAICCSVVSDLVINSWCLLL